jgi:hypothetical protein
MGELKLVGKDLYADIKRRGVMLPDGTVNPAVEANRKNAHEQMFSLQVFMEQNRTSSSEPRDIVAMMSAGCVFTKGFSRRTSRSLRTSSPSACSASAAERLMRASRTKLAWSRPKLWLPELLNCFCRTQAAEL